VAALAADAHSLTNAFYQGSWRGSPPTNKLLIHVSSNGRSADAKLWCFKAFQGTSPSFSISSRGYFKTAYLLAGELEWSAHGHFTSRTTAVANVHLAIACSGIGSIRNLAFTLV
jgi:hypothetical protein